MLSWLIYTNDQNIRNNMSNDITSLTDQCIKHNINIALPLYNPFRTDPSWNINSEPIMAEDHVKYLGPYAETLFNLNPDYV